MIGKRVVIKGEHPRKRCKGEVKRETQTVIGPMWFIRLEDGHATLAETKFLEVIE